MVGGVDRYYQIARCMRDEDLRADRQFEFTQLDMEASFVGQDDVLGFVSEAVLDAAEVATGERPPPIEWMTWAEALDRYGTDKPDLRFGMELRRPERGLRRHRGPGLRRPLREGAAAWPGGRPGPVAARRADRCGPSAPAPRAWPGSGSTRATPARRWTRRSTVSCPPRSGPGCSWAPAPRWGTWSWWWPTSTGRPARCSVRCASPSAVPRSARAPTATCGCSSSPSSTGSTATGRPVPAHHPFTMPHPDDLPLLEDDPAAVRSQAYDLVLNGWELGSGSVRIHRADIQRRIFAALGITEEEAEAAVRLPAGRLPLRGPAPRRLRLRHRPAGGRLRRGGEHPGGHRLPEDPVGGGPPDRRPEGAQPRRRWPSSACACRPGRDPGDRPPGAAGASPVTPGGPVRRGGRAAAGRVGPRWPPGCAPAPSTRWSASATWSGPGAPLRVLVESDRLGSVILWGPPGTGKTTLARLLAELTAKAFVPLSAVASGVKDVREALEAARRRLGEHGRGTILFVDEVHRFNKAQQDVLLPAVEDGTGGAGRGDHREPVLRGQRAADEPCHPVAARAARRRRAAARVASEAWPPNRRRPTDEAVGRPGGGGRRRRPGRPHHPRGGGRPGPRPRRDRRRPPR